MKTTDLIISLVFQNLVCIGVAFLFWTKLDLSIRDVGLFKPSVRLVAVSMAVGVLCAVSLFMVGRLELVVLGRCFPVSTVQRLTTLSRSLGAEQAFVGITSPQLKIAFVVCGSIIAPIGEEFLFRGLLLRKLVDNNKSNGKSVLVALSVSSLLFAVAHLALLSFVPLFLLGLVLGFMYIRTGVLWVPVIVHGVSNLVTFYMLLNGTT